MTGTTSRMSLLPLFLISAAAVGFETALTRYFAIAKWSEYGYWVISIVMVGFALSGVAMALARGWALRHGHRLLALLPLLLIPAAAMGYWAVTVNPFNPLQLQNSATWAPQIGNIALYYASLLPFFFLAGLYISLVFVLNAGRIPRVYGFDLTGAAAGAALVLLLMWLVAPFDLPAALLPLLAVAALLAPGWRQRAAALVLLAASEALLLGAPQADFNDFKAIFAPLHVEGSRVLATHRSPRGLYMLLDDFTERVDTDVSNDAGMLGVAGPPRAFGLYRDGNRIAALPNGTAEAGYALAALDALPYQLAPHPRVLLLGSSGGFRIAEVLALGAARVTALEPEPMLRGVLDSGFGPVAPFAGDPRVAVSAAAPMAAADGGKYDLVDISGDFLDAAEANATAFSVEALAADLRAVGPHGLVSVPAPIRDLPVYALRLLATARAALLAAGIADPAVHVLVWRSAWNARLLLSPAPFDAAEIAAARQFCDARSFDLSWAAGMAEDGHEIFNDLPAVAFDSMEMATGGPAQDAVAQEAPAMLAGGDSPSQDAFNLAPITMDRPFFYNVLRPEQTGSILRRLEILPQSEIGQLVNLAVLAQALVIALLVLLVPLLRGGRARRVALPALFVPRAVAYFAALGLGFLFVEIWLIEQASFYLNDRASAFALVLTGMLLFSGLGALLAGRVRQRGVSIAAVVLVLWSGVMLLFLRDFMLATLDLPFVLRGLILLVLLAPVSLAMGLPFPLGLTWAGAADGFFLPWAWGLNGAFSVVATPLANLLAVQRGYSVLLLGAGLFYVLCKIVEPSRRTIQTWLTFSARSPGVG